MLDASWELASREGTLPAPEGGATLAALHRLLEAGAVRHSETVVLFNTGSAYKYQENMPLGSTNG